MRLVCGIMVVYSFTFILTEAADLLQKLSLDSENKAVEVPEATNEVLPL